MTQEADDKIETILLSCINRLYEKESTVGLDFEDLRCLEILHKIKKDGRTSTSDTPINLEKPANLLELLRAAKGSPPDGDQ